MESRCYIEIFGATGIGKTTLAREVSNVLELERFDKIDLSNLDRSSSSRRGRVLKKIAFIIRHPGLIFNVLRLTKKSGRPYKRNFRRAIVTVNTISVLKTSKSDLIFSDEGVVQAVYSIIAFSDGREELLEEVVSLIGKLLSSLNMNLRLVFVDSNSIDHIVQNIRRRGRDDFFLSLSDGQLSQYIQNSLEAYRDIFKILSKDLNILKVDVDYVESQTAAYSISRFICREV